HHRRPGLLADDRGRRGPRRRRLVRPAAAACPESALNQMEVWSMTTTLRALMIIGAAITLAACGSGQVENPGGSGGSQANSGNKKLALVPGVANEPFYISMQCGAEEEAKAEGYTLQTQAPAQFDATLQEPIVTALAASKPAALLIAPTDDVA